MGLYVNMDGAAGVPAGVDGGELSEAFGVADLHAAEEASSVEGTAAAAWAWTACEIGRGTVEASASSSAAAGRAVGTACGEAGVDARGIAMPDIKCGVGQRSAGAGIDHGDAELQRHARFSFGDIGAELLIVDVVWAFFLLAGERTERRAGDAAAGDQEPCACGQKSSSCGPVK